MMAIPHSPDGLSEVEAAARSPRLTDQPPCARSSFTSRSRNASRFLRPSRKSRLSVSAISMRMRSQPNSNLGRGADQIRLDRHPTSVHLPGYRREGNRASPPRDVRLRYRQGSRGHRQDRHQGAARRPQVWSSDFELNRVTGEGDTSGGEKRISARGLCLPRARSVRSGPHPRHRPGCTRCSLGACQRGQR